ncbi:hypothetical protein BDR26DRAFT_929358 [Obelidium mucronatum]|nr:hypothetical protein BDR26DRAFT_929358 [Obelidium mucronatum]
MRATAIHSLTIPRAATRDYPQQHVSYQICIRGQPPSDANVWVVWKRYSDFVALDSSLRQSFPFAPPPAPLPPKTHALHALATALFNAATLNVSCAPSSASQTVDARRAALENYLTAMLLSRDERWRASRAFRVFLGLDADDSAPAAAAAAPASAAADAMDPDAWIARGESSPGRLVQIRNSVRSVSDRVGTLDQRMLPVQATSSPSYRTRAEVTISASLYFGNPKTGRYSAPSWARETTAALALQSSNSAELLGNRKTTLSGNSNRRAFGTQARETEKTVGLDNQGILQLQNQTIQEQDQILDALSSAVQRQRVIGETMGNELELQNQMLRELGEDLDHVGGNLKHASKKLATVRKG